MKTIIVFRDDGEIRDFLEGDVTRIIVKSAFDIYTSATATGTETNISEVSDAEEVKTLTDLWVDYRAAVAAANTLGAFRLTTNVLQDYEIALVKLIGEKISA